MKIKFGAIVTDGSGKLGGHVFSKNRAGNYIRTKVTPSNPQTTAQGVVRALFGIISAGWSALTQTARDSWDGAVGSWATSNIFGDMKNPTGKTLYQRLNNQALVAGYSAVALPPARLAMVSGSLTGAEFGIAATTLTLTGAYAGADARVMVVATSPQSAGTQFVKNKLRTIISPVGNLYTGLSGYASYEAKFGEPVIGQNIFVGVKYVLSTGQVSPLQTIRATVVA